MRKLSVQNLDYRLYAIGFEREEYVFYSRHFLTPVLTDILPVKVSHEVDEMTLAKQQIRLKKDIKKAADKVTLASVDAPTAQEIEALHQALHAVVQEAKTDREIAEAFERALVDVMENFGTEFNSESPAFVFIQEQDRKWLLPLFPDMAKLPVLRQESVGRRKMLLLANEAGARLVAAN